MEINTIKLLLNVFNINTTNKIYGRFKEKQTILSFIQSDKSILHINGKPGTGKTSSILECLNSENYLYINYYITSNIKKQINNINNIKILVIDEFDRYYNEKKNECINAIICLQKKNIKLITISNTLIINQKNYLNNTNIVVLNYKPYTKNQIIEIMNSILKTINNELIITTLFPKAIIEFIAKKHEKIGDLREIFKYINQLLKYILSRNIKKITLETLHTFEIQLKNKIIEQSIHHKIIINLIETLVEKKHIYREYICKCKEMKIKNYEKNDFDLIYGLYI